MTTTTTTTTTYSFLPLTPVVFFFFYFFRFFLQFNFLLLLLSLLLLLHLLLLSLLTWYRVQSYVYWPWYESKYDDQWTNERTTEWDTLTQHCRPASQPVSSSMIINECRLFLLLLLLLLMYLLHQSKSIRVWCNASWLSIIMVGRKRVRVQRINSPPTIRKKKEWVSLACWGLFDFAACLLDCCCCCCWLFKGG